MEERLPEDKLSELLPALSLLAERIGAGEPLEHSALLEILLDVGISEQAWAIEELRLWSKILREARSNSNDDGKTKAISQLRERGMADFPAILAVHMAINASRQVAVQPSPSSIKSSQQVAVRPLPSSIPKIDVEQPLEPYHVWLPDHGWHNDLTWERLPIWIRNNPRLLTALRHGREIVGRNVRYRLVGKRLVRRLRYSVHVKTNRSSAVGRKKPRRFVSRRRHG